LWQQEKTHAFVCRNLLMQVTEGNIENFFGLVKGEMQKKVAYFLRRKNLVFKFEVFYENSSFLSLFRCFF
jgi:hypothetical protein